MSRVGLMLLGLVVPILYVNGCMVGEIDLSFIESEICCTFGESEVTSYQLRYMPCEYNSVECIADGSFQMALQQEKRGGEVIECWRLAYSNDVPTISEQVIHGDNAYVLTYSDGFQNRITHFRFFCGDTVFDESKTTCNQIQTSQGDPPEYYLELYSSNICNVEPATSSSSKAGLSGGSIFVICFCSVFLFYCIIGYSVNGYRSENWKDISGNIPNYSMWKTLPKATIGGCIFTLGWIRGKCTKNNIDLNDFIDE